MRDINTVTIVGRLTRDAEVKALPSGVDVVEFSIASNYSVKRGDDWADEASFFDVTKFKPGGLSQYLTKGRQVFVSGELRQERWEKDGAKRSRVRIIAQAVQLAAGGEKAEKADAPREFEDDVTF